MTTEEKAKAYDEALKRARKELQACGSTVCDAARQIFRFFPELAESEDERIKKELIFYLGDMPEDTELRNGVTNRDVLVWLEKQGEQKHRFVIGDIISNGKVEFCVDNIVKNAIGQDCYFLVNIEDEKNGIRYLQVNNSEGKTYNYGEITWICEQVDAKFEKQGEMSKNCPTSVQDKSPININEMVAKYSQTKDGDFGLPINCQIRAYRQGLEDGINSWKPAWSEEDDYNVQCLVAKANCDIQKGNVGRNEELIDWLKSLRNRVKSQPDMVEALRTEYEKGRADTIAEMEKDWSEEDDVMINKLLAVVKLYYDRSGDDLDKQSCISFLKSLKDKVQPQPKQEWSEEDEIARKALINLVEIYYGGCIDKTEKKRLLNLLKSLRPQNTWKPSEEQMSTLNLIISDYYHACTKECDKKAIVLKSILEQLKQL